MELTKKTTILFTPELHKRLEFLAAERKTSLGELVREACKKTYGLFSTEDRLKAVDRMAEMNLPVGTPEQMERESTETITE